MKFRVVMRKKQMNDRIWQETFDTEDLYLIVGKRGKKVPFELKNHDYEELERFGRAVIDNFNANTSKELHREYLGVMKGE